jgi:hypothetical protein
MKTYIGVWFMILISEVMGFPRMSKVIGCKQLYGEWQIRYSDDPQFPGKSASIGIIPETGMNRVRISVYPAGHFNVMYRFYRGLLLNEISQKGSYHVHERIGSHIEMSIRFHNSHEKIVSFCGIAIDDIHPLIRIEESVLTYKVEAEIIGNDMFIIAKNMSTPVFYYHLIRSDSLNQPTIEIPLSNLIFSNILTMMLTYTIHIFFHISVE